MKSVADSGESRTPSRDKRCQELGGFRHQRPRPGRAHSRGSTGRACHSRYEMPRPNRPTTAREPGAVPEGPARRRQLHAGGRKASRMRDPDDWYPVLCGGVSTYSTGACGPRGQPPVARRRPQPLERWSPAGGSGSPVQASARAATAPQMIEQGQPDLLGSASNDGAHH